MTRFLRAAPRALVSGGVALLLIVFIGVPIGAVLVESFVIAGPMPPERLKAVTANALDRLPAQESTALVKRWGETATEAERVEATAAAFQLAGIAPSWDRKAPYSDQARAMESALAALSAQDRELVTENQILAHVMLHKRTALAFRVKSLIDQQGFDTLRNGSESRWGFDHYLKLFQDSYLRSAGLNSLSLAALSVLFTVPLAFALAYGINGGGVPWPAALRGVFLMPLVAPPVLVATATVMLFGRRGLVTHTVLDRGLGLIDADETNLYGLLGVVLAQMLSFMPAALIIFDNILRRQDGRVDEAAASLGAGHFTTFRHVTLPLAWPATKRAIVLVFIMSLTDFGNPMILGRDTPVLAGVIYDEITAYRNTPLAAALCVWLIIPSLILYLGLELIGRRKGYTSASVAGRSEFTVPRAWRIGLTTIAGVVSALIFAVYGTMALGAVTKVWGTDWSLTLGYFSAEGVRIGLAGTGYGSSERGLGLVWDSLGVGIIAGPIGGLFAVVIAYVVERLRPPGANLIVFLVLVPAILPGIIFGIGYIVAFNVPFGIPALSLTGTSAILIINILFSNIFVGVLAARAALQRVDRSIDEAAESLGAGLVSRLFKVTLPILLPALLLGTLYVFIDALTTLSSVIFLVSGNHKLASVAIFNHANSGEYGYAAAKSLVLLAFALGGIGLARLLERRRETAGRSRQRPVLPSLPSSVAR
ncbi:MULTISPECIES: iron ABC transporter permease [unclassified Chelatococcus]|uniref:ABC transporter permease n=1 Tax=unclassified Chelatococcus TaxID=2638111 RepID=UPI001BCDCEA5|nr:MULTISPECIES: iron ABC transporter permease [unclassified Chelatococcus]MBS7700272.1 iron ABC transporter permease [Chelatococcus sp. YT9]MBX3558243.1 iron ABC transporter permease [Chelatococcus sp.]